MDPKVIAMLRLMTGLDDKLLPDSMTTEDFGTFIEKQKGKLFGTPEDIKNLQKIISGKDVDLTKTKKHFEKLLEDSKKSVNKDDKKVSDKDKKIDDLVKVVDDLKDTISKGNQVLEVAALKKKYPDIVPSTLIGKTDDEQKTIVEEQRAMNKRNYGDSKLFTQPTYTDVADVDKAIDAIKADTEMGSVKKGVQLLKLNRIKTGFIENPPEPEPES